jgi:hypothetical protein
MMARRRLLIRCSVLTVLAIVVLGSTGCTYLRYRVQDAAEMVDIGVTLSYKPGLALWAAAPFSLGAGIGGYVDGYMVGLGGGHPFFVRHKLSAIGVLVFGFEELGWGPYDKKDPATFYRTYQGVLGIPLSFGMARPAYMPTCNHEIHLFFVGLVGNLRYMEILDFLVGFTTLDIAGDDGDGEKLGSWPWRAEEGMDEQFRNNTLWPWGPTYHPPDAE